MGDYMTDTYHQQLRLLPSVNELLQTEMGRQLTANYSYALTVDMTRETLIEARTAIRAGLPCPSQSELLATIARNLQEGQRAHLRPVINATGVIINTNLGRAPLSVAALE